MNSIVPIKTAEINGRPVNAIDARDLHEMLGVDGEFSTWINDRISDSRFAPDRDYAAFAEFNADRLECHFYLSLDTAQQIAKGEKGKCDCDEYAAPLYNRDFTPKRKRKFTTQYQNSNGLFGLMDAGRALGCKPQKFVQWLISDGYCERVNDIVSPLGRMKRSSYFEVQYPEIGSSGNLRTFITVEGLEHFAERVPKTLKA